MPSAAAVPRPTSCRNGPARCRWPACSIAASTTCPRKRSRRASSACSTRCPRTPRRIGSAWPSGWSPPDNPLTARVTVNRFWQELFGTGLVRTTGDFGVSGELPSHPELLDWLAVEFRETGWDVKKLMRLMVTSATYRQSAHVTQGSAGKGPAQHVSSRGPRFRMDAEMIRDNALAVSGLLVKKIGGPSVKPYQPDGVWDAVAMRESNTRDYRQDKGESLYRRGMYTFWKRAAPPPSMDILNAPSREYCTVRRERTNTPAAGPGHAERPAVRRGRPPPGPDRPQGRRRQRWTSRIDFMARGCCRVPSGRRR